MSVRLDDIDYFLAVVQCGQLRAAAEQLNLSQPALTKAIQRLEAEVGFPLFARSNRGMRLTRAAEHFYECTRSLRGGLSEAVREAQDLHLGSMGVLRVGISPLHAASHFVPASLRLHQQRPAAKLSVMINLNDVLLAALRRGEIELCIHAVPASVPEDLDVQPLFTDDIRMVVRPGHPLVQKSKLRLADLVGAHWMLPPAGVQVRRSIEALFTHADLPAPSVAIEVNNSATSIYGLLLNSDLIGIASAVTLRSSAGQGLVALPLNEGRFARQIGLFTRHNHALSHLAQRFVEVLMQSNR
jgi:DNA-binding transcriptional LysR family regulator